MVLVEKEEEEEGDFFGEEVVMVEAVFVFVIVVVDLNSNIAIQLFNYKFVTLTTTTSKKTCNTRLQSPGSRSNEFTFLDFPLLQEAVSILPNGDVSERVASSLKKLVSR